MKQVLSFTQITDESASHRHRHLEGSNDNDRKRSACYFILATLVQELTHIWHHDNLDCIRMNEEKRTLLKKVIPCGPNWNDRTTHMKRNVPMYMVIDTGIVLMLERVSDV